MAESDERRIRYRDLIPYAAPDRLEDLDGPAHGVVKLPVTACIDIDREVDLDSATGRHKLVHSLVQEGTVSQQIELLNADLLRTVWPRLTLDSRCQELWESRFPELTELRDDS
jgi:hypothetical protein